eukprot:5957363-Amphidinium_carterae.2
MSVCSALTDQTRGANVCKKHPPTNSLKNLLRVHGVDLFTGDGLSKMELVEGDEEGLTICSGLSYVFDHPQRH